MTSALVDRHRRDIDGVARLAQRDLELILGDIVDATAARDLLATALPDLVSVYGSAAATLAADFYEELRAVEEVAGRFVARPAALPDVARTDSLARWATDPLFSATPDRLALLARAAGGLQRTVANADRHTIMQSSIADPRAQGWKRRASAKACGFCRMLVDRGAVYTGSSVDFGAHDHCGCIAVPEFGGDVKATGRKATAPRNISDRDRARTAAWMSEHGY